MGTQTSSSHCPNQHKKTDTGRKNSENRESMLNCYRRNMKSNDVTDEIKTELDDYCESNPRGGVADRPSEVTIANHTNAKRKNAKCKTDGTGRNQANGVDEQELAQKVP